MIAPADIFLEIKSSASFERALSFRSWQKETFFRNSETSSIERPQQTAMLAAATVKYKFVGSGSGSLSVSTRPLALGGGNVLPQWQLFVSVVGFQRHGLEIPNNSHP